MSYRIVLSSRMRVLLLLHECNPTQLHEIHNSYNFKYFQLKIGVNIPYGYRTWRKKISPMSASRKSK